MKRSTAKILLVILNILTIVGGCVIIAVTNANKAAVWLFVGVMLVISLVLGSFLRCRHCGRGQGRGWLFAQYCPHCGESLDD